MCIFSRSGQSQGLLYKHKNRRFFIKLLIQGDLPEHHWAAPASRNQFECVGLKICVTSKQKKQLLPASQNVSTVFIVYHISGKGLKACVTSKKKKKVLPASQNVSTVFIVYHISGKGLVEKEAMERTHSEDRADLDDPAW